MNYSQSNGVIIDSRERVAFINGVEVPFRKDMKGHSISTINGTVYVDGFEYKDGAWKKTIKAWYNKYF